MAKLKNKDGLPGGMIISLNGDNMETYVADILESEKLFPESIRMGADELEAILNGGRAAAKVLLLDEKYVGNMLGFCVSEKEIEEFGLEGIVHNPGHIYVYNFLVLPEHQRKGHGMTLQLPFMESAKALGYAAIEGHANMNTAMHLVRKFKHAELGIHENWAGTGDPYMHCTQKL